MSDEMPRNMIASSDKPERDDAAKEAEWLANNVPEGGLSLRWRYENKSIQLFERHLRSLANYKVGPALRSYLRTRLEWLGDEKVYARPSGVVVVTINEQGECDAYLAEANPAPELTLADTEGFDGSVWTLDGGKLYCTPEADQMKGACETFAKDLAVTLAKSLGYEYVGGPSPTAASADAEVVAVNDEFGMISVANPGAFTQKMEQCFDKLWSK